MTTIRRTVLSASILAAALALPAFVRWLAAGLNAALVVAGTGTTVTFAQAGDAVQTVIAAELTVVAGVMLWHFWRATRTGD